MQLCCNEGIDATVNVVLFTAQKILLRRSPHLKFLHASHLQIHFSRADFHISCWHFAPSIYPLVSGYLQLSFVNCTSAFDFYGNVFKFLLLQWCYYPWCVCVVFIYWGLGRLIVPYIDLIRRRSKRILFSTRINTNQLTCLQLKLIDACSMYNFINLENCPTLNRPSPKCK